MGGLYTRSSSTHSKSLLSAAAAISLSSCRSPSPPLSACTWQIVSRDFVIVGGIIRACRCKPDANYSYTYWRFRYIIVLPHTAMTLPTDTFGGYHCERTKKKPQTNRFDNIITLINGDGGEGITSAYILRVYITPIYYRYGCLPISVQPLQSITTIIYYNIIA